MIHTTTLGDSVQPVEYPVCTPEKPDLFLIYLASVPFATNDYMWNIHETFKAPQVASSLN
jgi:hypothetical protein